MPTAVIGPRAPLNEYPPEVFGETLQDGILEAFQGWWRGTPELTFAYQWFRCNEEGEECAAIVGATEFTYTAQAVDVGQTLRVEVSATNEAGSAEANSPPSEVIGPPLLPVLEGAPPTISGFLSAGRTLNAEAGEWSGHGPIEFAYQWLRCNEEGEECEAIAEASEATYLTNSEDLGKRLKVKVTATNTSGTASEVSEATESIASEAPADVTAPWIFGGQRPGAELEAYPGEWSGSGPIEFAYQWQRCNLEGEECEAIAGAEEATYTASAEDARHALRALVTATGPVGSESVSSEGHRILPELSESKSPPTVTGTLALGKTLTATSGEWSPEPDQLLYHWQKCSATGTGCFDTGATGSTHTLVSGDVEHTFRIRVTAHNEGEAEWESPSEVSAVTGVINPKTPVNKGVPTISPTTPVAGEAESATTGTWLGEPTLTYGYQWQLCFTTSSSSCENLEGATSSSFTPSPSLVNQRIRVRVRAENANGTNFAASAISQKVEKGAPEPPQNLNPPSIGGYAFDGDVLEGFRGSWSEVWEYTYEWRRCDGEGKSCAAISGAEEDTYGLVGADVGHTIRFVITAHNGAGEESATTNPTAVVSAATRPEVEEAPEIEGAAEVSKPLTAYQGQWDGSPKIGFDYLWKLCDAAGRHCAAISGADSQTYYPRRSDAGHTIRLQVTATNSWGSVSASSEPTAVLPAPAPIANIAIARLEPGWNAPEFGVTYQAYQLGEWEGEPAIAVHWQRCDPLTEEPESGEMECVDIAGAEDAEEYVPQKADVGFKLRLKEIASVPGEEAFAYSEPTAEVVLAAVAKGKGSYSGPLIPGSTITADSTVSSEASLPITVDYKFLRLGEEGPEELQDGSSPTYEIVEADLGYELKIEMTASVMRADEAEVLATRWVTVTTGKVEVPPANDTLPSISGETASGATLKAETGEWHGGGGPLSYAFQWRRCDEEGKGCADISTATKATYTLTGEDISSTLRLAVTAASGSFKETATSEPSAVVTPSVAPSSEEAPVISGELAELSTVGASEGAWSGSEPITYTYQWQGCESEEAGSCLDIEGGAEPTLRLDQLETGQWLRVVVKATNPGGSVTAASEIVGPVAQAPPPKLNEVPSLSVLGPASVGSTLTTDGGSWENVDSAELEYQWLRCNSEACEEIESADQQTYGLVKEDIGSKLEVEVTASNSSARMSVTSELSPEITESTGSLHGKMVYLTGGRGAVMTANEEGEEEEGIAGCNAITGHAECTLHGPRISPDGEMIAVEDRDPEAPVGTGTIYLMNFDGTDSRALTAGSEPQWSPDGSRVYFTGLSEETEAPQLYVADADGSSGSEPTAIPGPSGSAEGPAISPDGSLLAYTGREAGEEQSSIFIANANGTSRKRLELAPNITEAFDPTFSADGSRIIFDAISPEHIEFGPDRWYLHRLWAVDTNGSDLHPLVPVSSDTYSAPSVGPNGILSSKETLTWVSTGFGGFFEYSVPHVIHLKSEGEDPSTRVTGTEPDALWGVNPIKHIPDLLDCPEGIERCKPWTVNTKTRAAAYAYKWSEEPKGKHQGPYYANLEKYWHFGDNCTNFVSQVWAAGGQEFMYERGDRNKYGLNWWAGRHLESPYEGKEENYNWTNVNGFMNQQMLSGRAKLLSEAETQGKNLQVGDVILLDWGADGEYNHSVVVNESSGEGRFISSETANRQGKPWHEEVTEIIPTFMREKQAEYGTTAWSWRILRPTFRASNRR